MDELKLVVRGSLSQVGSLQDCFLQQIEPEVQYTGKHSPELILSSLSYYPREPIIIAANIERNYSNE